VARSRRPISRLVQNPMGSDLAEGLRQVGGFEPSEIACLLDNMRKAQLPLVVNKYAYMLLIRNQPPKKLGTTSNL
jgi:hypothetical protein